MKKLSLLILIFLGLLVASCDNPQSIRYLVRSASKAAKENPDSIAFISDYGNAKLVKVTKLLDTLGLPHFKACYIMPKDTFLYLETAIANMPQMIGFENKIEKCVVTANFFWNENLFKQNFSFNTKTIEFSKKGEQYNAEKIY